MPYKSSVNHAANTSDNEIIGNAREFIKNKLYFTSLPSPPSQQPVNWHLFSIDQTLVYVNFYSDFGPFNLSHAMRFCEIMTEKLQNPLLSHKKLCLYSSLDADKRANAAFVLCFYMMIVYKLSPEEAYRPLLDSQPPFLPYRDAGYGAATYHITILDCLKGIWKAVQIGLLNIDSVDLEEYEFYEKVENGDLNWISNKFIALASPHDDPPNNPRVVQLHQPQVYGVPTSFAGITGVFSSLIGSTGKNASGLSNDQKKLQSVYQIDNLIRFLKEKNVNTIIRLNNKLYDRKKFLDAGIDHVELYFPDGTTPSDGILKRFLDLCESRAGPIAIHCKAGLGRTGTLIAAYFLKHYRLTTPEVIGFMRVLRPGSVVGPQQNYLQSMQTKLWKMNPVVPLPIEISCLQISKTDCTSRFPQIFDISSTNYIQPPTDIGSPMSLEEDEYLEMGDESKNDRVISTSQETDNKDRTEYHDATNLATSATRIDYRQKLLHHRALEFKGSGFNQQDKDYSTNYNMSYVSLDETQLSTIPLQPRKTPSSPIRPIQQVHGKGEQQDWKRAVSAGSPIGNYAYTSANSQKPIYGAVIQQQLTQSQLLPNKEEFAEFLIAQSANTKSTTTKGN